MTIVLKIICILCFTLIGLALIGSFGPHKVKLVKTVTGFANHCDYFDNAVNICLHEGYRLTQIVCTTEEGKTRLIAFLEK